MFVRFAGAIVVIVLIALAGIRLEKENLELRRAVSLQHYRLEVLERRHALHRLKVQQLGAPARMIESLESGELQVMVPPRKPTKSANELIARDPEQARRLH
ncbi:hypothetical protein Pan258_21750 [Symmachiella dynata]|uniref:Uncharacterized protein n=1 Tax=Symmachiella dynata TaxID=2527995 RepID=A0A517ZMP0_9PLAN|nr:hypothetical protein [Symmachiella dynata]QDT48135.1 hypothetical protein Pan258_21750 [Symmachiella dynata]QDU43746.1 hypothetical protein Mal52_22220 [Symmachiella dynata]